VSPGSYKKKLDKLDGLEKVRKSGDFDDGKGCECPEDQESSTESGSECALGESSNGTGSGTISGSASIEDMTKVKAVAKGILKKPRCDDE